ncbi:MAG: cation diffusion facilitator family transporter [Patescibacteria group bacterium]
MPEEKHKSNKKTHAENLRHATTVARNSLFLLIALTIIKAFGGYVTNIVALVGDAVGSFTDIIAMSGIYVGLKLSQQKASNTFKYGYHRVETLVSLFISLFMLYAGYKILTESYVRLFVSVKTSFHTVGIITAVISIGISLFAFHYHRKTATSINSKALMASAYDKRNDAMVSLGVLISVVADKTQIPYVEGTVGILIAILILWTGLKDGKDALFYLLDYWDDPAVTNKIKAILKKSKIVTAVKRIRLRHAGTYIFGEAFLEINPFTDSKDLRDEIHRLDREVEKNVEHLGDIVLYINPPKPTVVHVAIPIRQDKGLDSALAENPKIPFHFLFVEINENKIKKFYSSPKRFSIDQVAEIAKFLKDQKVNILISSLIRPLLYYNLRLNNIRVYPHFLDVKDVKNTVKLLLLDI